MVAKYFETEKLLKGLVQEFCMLIITLTEDIVSKIV